MRRVGWVFGVVAALVTPGAASAKRPEPVPESQLQPCIELMRERLAGLAASNESQVATELTVADALGNTRDGIALATRPGVAGTELVLVSFMPMAVGGTGAIGAWPFTITEMRRGYAIATVKAPLADVEAHRAKDRSVSLELGPDRYPGEPGTYPPVADNGTRMSREVTVAAVAAMNKQGGLPWLAWDTGARPVLKRVKVVPFNDDAVEWVPVKDPDSAMHPLFVFALDLEKNGTPYLAIAYNNSPVSDRTEIWRPTKGKWKKVGAADGNLTVVRRTANPNELELVFDNYLDTTLVRVEAAGPPELETQCVANDGMLVNGGEGAITWPRLTASERPRTIKPGDKAVPSFSFLSIDAPDGEVARGTRVWRFAVVGDKTLVALEVRDKKALSKDLRKMADRVLELAWVDSSEIE
ncbi:MAG TPA: hypothetical protein PK095_08215 [Myxococcota bacterium]|nr:hypothetical protein [Myxococcota bacterium]